MKASAQWLPFAVCYFLPCSRHQGVLTAFTDLILTSIITAREKSVVMVSSRLWKEAAAYSLVASNHISAFLVMTMLLHSSEPAGRAKITQLICLRSLLTLRLRCYASLSLLMLRPSYTGINVTAAGLCIEPMTSPRGSPHPIQRREMLLSPLPRFRGL
jgi:hypothetical protein